MQTASQLQLIHKRSVVHTCPRTSILISCVLFGRIHEMSDLGSNTAASAPSMSIYRAGQDAGRPDHTVE